MSIRRIAPPFAVTKTLALAVLLAIAGSAISQEPAPPPAAPGAAPAAPAAPPAPAARPDPLPPKPFKDVIKDAKEIPGLFKLYQKDEKIWIEIKPDQLDKPFFSPTTYLPAWVNAASTAARWAALK